MCLVALSLGAHERYPLVIAANRDELYARPTEGLTWWSPVAGAPWVLSGRDLEAGGTWMGLTAAGRLALVTNIRASGKNDAAALSRGRIVTDWLASSEDADQFSARVAARRHNGYNLIAADFRTGEWFWTSSTTATAQRLPPGIHALSNAALDTPWPKVIDLKDRVAAALRVAPDIDALAIELFAALADRTIAADALLPRTGMPPEIERQLSSAFVDVPARRYGTRCSTLLITERDAEGCDRTHVLERSFDVTRKHPLPLRRTVLEEWPPLPGAATRAPAPQPVLEVEPD